MRRLNPLHVVGIASLLLLQSCGGGGGGSDPTPAVLPSSVVVTVPTGADISQAVAFTSSATSSTGLSFAWDFGDGGTSTDTNPQHSYAKPGDYSVKLTLSNGTAQVSGTSTVQVNDTARLRDLFCTGSNGQGWCALRYPQTSMAFADIFWSTGTQGLAVGAAGDIAATQDGGQTWVPRSLDLLLDDDQPQRLTLTDANTAWVFTDRHLWQSVDAGKHWTRLTDALAGNAAPTSLFAQGNGRIWAPSLNRFSGDAGKTWTTRNLPPEARGVFTHSGHFLDSYYTASGAPAGPMLPEGPLWLWDGGRASSSTDGGATWTAASAAPACAPVFANALPPLQVRGTALVAQLGAQHAGDGDHWAFCVSQDGGTSWKQQSSEGLPTFGNYVGPKPSLYTPLSSAAVRLLPAGGGWALGADGALYRSTGLDQAWRAVALPAGFSSQQILAAPDSSNLVISATGPQDSFLLSTSDGGVSWRSQRFVNTAVTTGGFVPTRVQVLGNDSFAARGTSSFLSASGLTFMAVDLLTWSEPRLFDKTSGAGLLASGNAGLLQGTGRSPIWQTAWNNACGFIRHIAYGSASRAWALGDSNEGGRLCTTRDGGASVQALSAMTLSYAPGATSYYADVAAVDESKVWVARFDQSTSSTAVLASSNGGDSWGSAIVINGLQAERLKALDAQHLVLLGGIPGTVPSGSCVAASTDGGQAWTQTCFATTFNNIAWSDAQTLWLVGETVMRSSDAGRTWVQVDVSLPARGALWALHFPTPSYGVLVGNNGLIVVTKDGGKTWKRQAQATGQTLTGVSFIDTKNGWITGIGVSLGTGSGGD